MRLCLICADYVDVLLKPATLFRLHTGSCRKITYEKILVIIFLKLCEICEHMFLELLQINRISLNKHVATTSGIALICADFLDVLLKPEITAD